MRISPPDRIAESVAGLFLASFVGISLPVVGAGITLSRDGRWLITANGVSNDVSLVDTATRKEVARVKVGERPWGVDILP